MLPFVIPVIFIFLAILAPILEYLRIPESASVYKSIHFLCHQLPTRSIFLFTSPMGLCARCFGIYVGLFIIGLITFQHRGYKLSIKYIIILTAPCLLDGTSQALGWRLSTNFLRFNTGLLAGLGIGSFLYPLWHMSINNFEKIKHRFFIYTTSIAIFLYILFGSSHFLLASTNQVILRDGTPVILILNTSIRSDQVAQGSIITLRVGQDICIDGLCVIKSNSPAIAKISIAKSNDIVGQEGRVVISFESVQAYDGSTINLRSLLDIHGENRETIAVAAGYIVCPLFGFIKGSQADIPAGTTLKAFTCGDYKFLKH